jgi:hypothetical protein
VVLVLFISLVNLDSFVLYTFFVCLFEVVRNRWILMADDYTVAGGEHTSDNEAEVPSTELINLDRS